MLPWGRAGIIEEDLIYSGIIRDFVELRDSDASESNIVDILNYLYTDWVPHFVIYSNIVLRVQINKKINK